MLVNDGTKGKYRKYVIPFHLGVPTNLVDITFDSVDELILLNLLNKQSSGETASFHIGQAQHN